jgi:c-di-GMP-binding flagellar brake protein YcgR
MLKERRRYFRQPVKMLVQVIIDGKTVKATSTNLSEGGIALMLREALPKGATTHLKFSLPEANLHLEVESEVAWADVKGRVGLRFRNVPQSDQERLEQWLDERMEEEFPGAKQRLAAAESETKH